MSGLHPDLERLALLGWRLHPASQYSRAACFKGALDAATCDLDQLERWQHEYPGCNWRVVMAGSGVWALDVDRQGHDHKEDGIAALRGLVAKHGALPPRPATLTGSGGFGLFWRDAGHPVRARSGWPLPGLDPRAGRVTITVPPSRHLRTGTAYRWLVAPWDMAPPEAPAWLLAAVAPPPEPSVPRAPFVPTTDRAHRRLHRAIDNIASAAPGSANDTLNKEAFAVARYAAAGLISDDEAVSAIYAAARNRRVPDREARDTLKSAFRAAQRFPMDARR